MLCDKLKDYDYDPDFPFQCRGRFYVADEVVAAIDELKQKLEDAKATHYAESVDAGMRERRLKRALWLTRAMRAQEMRAFFNNARGPYWGYNVAVWEKIESKCRAKAEQYK